MKIKRVTVTPIAFRDPPLLNASGIHEPFALRSIIEIESDNGYIGLGESYGDAPALAIQQQLQDKLIAWTRSTSTSCGPSSRPRLPPSGPPVSPAPNWRRAPMRARL